MCAACRADCRGSRPADLLLTLALETLDNRALLPFPKILEFAEDRGGGSDRCSRSLLADSQLKAGFWRKRRKIATALATNRALGRRILHLLEATMWTFHIDFCRRRTGHRTLTPKFPFYQRPPNAALIGSLERTTSGRPGAPFAETIPLVTPDLPIKVAPSSITRRAAFKSPCSVHFDFSSQRSATVMLPCTLPYTVIDLVFTSPRMSAFSPIVKTPSELISPSTFPSMRSSFWNLIEPLISTSLERMSLPPCSAIGFW